MIRAALRPVGRPLRAAARRVALERDVVVGRFRTADLALFHEFAPAPAGGAHQSLGAFVREVRRRGGAVELNTLSAGTDACLFNSFNFDFARLRRLAASREDVRRVHRVGAVTTLYRGYDDGTDARTAEINRELADATIAISHATIAMYRSIGIELVDPHVVHNPVDSQIFHARNREPFRRDRKIRLIATSWSANPRKGTPTYRWLEDQLDWDRYEFTFVGNSPVEFEHIRHVPPVPSGELAELLRSHDVYITATEHDAYSNALVEALSCGLPALYLDSGGSGEAVGDAGLAFRDREEIATLLDRLVDEYEERQAAIALPSLAGLVDGYLRVLGIERLTSVRRGDSG
jgi:glycosyltransferase involved in cell wall biosynthesis